MRTAAFMQTRETDLKYFYELIRELLRVSGGYCRLSSASGRDNWPERGLYFFFEGGERRRGSGTGDRVVRVGTHALTAGSRATLWNRLSQHRGSFTSRGGNHRGSIFRLLVGKALIKRERLSCPTWGTLGGSAPKDVRAVELSMEQRVSAEIGAMPMLCLGVDDAPGPGSDRGRIEQGSIALLSEFGKPALDPASPKWLGHDCDRLKVRQSGLWNNRHVDETYDPTFLDVMAHWVKKQGGKR
jgi:hypothetical protein